MSAHLRASLIAIQRNTMHAMIGTLSDHEIDGVRRVRTLGAVCPRCPVKRECRRASLALAEAETKVIGGVDG